MSFPHEITTERLLLRPPREEDAQNVFARYGHDPRVSKYMSWKPHQSIEDTVAYLRRVIADNANGTSVGYLIFAGDSGELAGSIGGKLETTQIQFGYCLAHDAWGQGFATEAARAFVAAAAREPHLWRIQAFCDVENCASAGVLEKCGLSLEGVLRRFLVLPNLGDEPRDVFCFAKVRENR